MITASNFKISKKKIWIIACFFSAISIDSLPYILPSNIAIICNIWLPMLLSAYYLIEVLNRKRSQITNIILFFFLLLIGSTAIHDFNNIYWTFVQIAPTVAVVLLTEHYMRISPDVYLKSILDALFILLIIDLLSIIMFPGGLYHSALYTDCWFLGYKTPRVRLVTMPIVMISAILSLKKNERLSIRFWIIAIFALLDTYLSKNMGGVACILGFLALLLVLYDSKHKRVRTYALKIFNFKVLLILVVGATIVVNIFQNLSAFSIFMDSISEKNTSMIARTRIWTVCIEMFKNNPILGNGYVLSSDFSRMVGFPEATQPHSVLMAVLVYTGILGIVVFMIMLSKALSFVKVKDGLSISTVCGCYIICVLFHGIISMHLFAPFLYSSMIILYYLSLDEEIKIKKERYIK